MFTTAVLAGLKILRLFENFTGKPLVPFTWWNIWRIRTVICDFSRYHFSQIFEHLKINLFSSNETGSILSGGACHDRCIQFKRVPASLSGMLKIPPPSSRRSARGAIVGVSSEVGSQSHIRGTFSFYNKSVDDSF